MEIYANKKKPYEQHLVKNCGILYTNFLFPADYLRLVYLRS